jgi:hypothetical protein
MEMLVVVFRSSMTPDVLDTLSALGVDAYTDLPRVRGVGSSGAALDAFPWPASNSIILAALESDQAKAVVDGLARFRDAAASRQRGAHVPLRVFTLPCVQVL